MKVSRPVARLVGRRRGGARITVGGREALGPPLFDCGAELKPAVKRPTVVLVAGDVSGDRDRVDVEVDEEVSDVSHTASVVGRGIARVGEAPGDFGCGSLIFHRPPCRVSTSNAQGVTGW
jgi:hypothetical protein